MGPGVDNPACNEYNIFNENDVNCAPVILKKLNRRLKAIKKYLDDHPGDKKSPLTAVMHAYARQKADLEKMCAHARVRIDFEESKHGSDSEEEEDFD